MPFDGITAMAAAAFRYAAPMFLYREMIIIIIRFDGCLRATAVNYLISPAAAYLWKFYGLLGAAEI